MYVGGLGSRVTEPMVVDASGRVLGGDGGWVCPTLGDGYVVRECVFEGFEVR